MMMRGKECERGGEGGGPCLLTSPLFPTIYKTINPFASKAGKKKKEKNSFFAQLWIFSLSIRRPPPPGFRLKKSFFLFFSPPPPSSIYIYTLIFLEGEKKKVNHVCLWYHAPSKTCPRPKVRLSRSFFK